MFVVTFVRHGETECNVANIIQSHTPGELTERGHSMGEHLGIHLAEEKFTRIYSSDLKRCHDTTLNILKHSSHHAPQKEGYSVEELLVLDEMLRERSCGPLELQSGEELAKIMRETGLKFPYMPIPGGEPYPDFKQRTAKFFNMLCKLADVAENEENVLVVTHGGWLMGLLDHLVECPHEIEDFDESLVHTRPHNTATTKLVIHKNDYSKINEGGKRKVTVKHVHDVSHLPDHLQKEV